MSNTKINVALDPPRNPQIGDIHAEQHDDGIDIFIWDGDHWVYAFGNDDSKPEVEVDTPEKAYDRAMGILG